MTTNIHFTYECVASRLWVSHGTYRFAYLQVRRDAFTGWPIDACCPAYKCAAVCCSVLQCAAVCYSVLQSAVMCCSVLQCAACAAMRCPARVQVHDVCMYMVSWQVRHNWQNWMLIVTWQGLERCSACPLQHRSDILKTNPASSKSKPPLFDSTYSATATLPTPSSPQARRATSQEWACWSIYSVRWQCKIRPRMEESHSNRYEPIFCPVVSMDMILNARRKTLVQIS